MGNHNYALHKNRASRDRPHRRTALVVPGPTGPVSRAHTGETLSALPNVNIQGHLKKTYRPLQYI